MKKNILVVGLGGQGVVKLSQLISKIALSEGFNARMTSQQGMAQRGGPVVCHVRYGEINTPIIPKGSSDILISMEIGETTKYSSFINSDSIILINGEKIESIDVASGKEDYPKSKEILNKLRKLSSGVKLLKARKTAEELELPVAGNMYMLGSFIKSQEELDRKTAEKVIEKEFNELSEEKFKKNFKLFDMGNNFEGEKDE